MSRLLGRLIDIISIIVLIIGQSEWMMYLSFILSALSYNLESGTDSAYVYDLLMETHEQDTFPKIQGRREIVIQMATLLATTIGGIIAGLSYQLTYGLSILVVIISIFVLMQMKEIRNQHYVKTHILNDMKQQVIMSYQLIKEDHQIFYLILSTSLFSASLTTCYYYLTNYWTELGIKISSISIFLSLENVAAMIAIPFYPISILAICVMAFFETILYIAMTTFLNEKVESHLRATLLSVLSLGFSLVMIIYFPLVGLIGEFFGLKIAYITLFVVVSVIYIVYQYVIRKQYEKIS